jgi:hypothetical protein
MKSVKARLARRLAKAMKPRNPVVVALARRQGSQGAGAHRKTRKAERQAQKRSLARTLDDGA